MLMLKLELNGSVKEFAPLSRIEGVCGWSMDKPPKNAVLRLFWYTEGRGTQDVGIVEEMALSAGQLHYEQPFSFTLPAEPYTFSGTLISLRWAIELTVNSGKEVARLDFTLSPWSTELVLKQFEGEPR